MADEYGLVLASQQIPFEIEAEGANWIILVSPAHTREATLLLDSYEEERLRTLSIPPLPPASRRTRAAMIAAFGLIALQAGWELSGLRDWVVLGGNTRESLTGGEVWRPLTALTLHSGWPHALGNALTLAIFGTAVVARFGAGLGLLAVLLSGLAGNLLTALSRSPGHLSIGASTAVFGSVGVLAATAATERRLRGRRWLPLAAGLGILAMLGAGPDSDVVAHLFGFGAGLVLGAILRMIPVPPVGSSLDRVLTAVSAALPALAWTWAVSSAGKG